MSVATIDNFIANSVEGITLGYLGPNSRPLSLLKKIKDPGLKICMWPAYEIVPNHVPLRTSGMVCCCAFIIQTPTKHYMLHLNPISRYSDEGELTKHLREVFCELTNKSIKLSIIPGCCNSTQETVNTLLNSLAKVDIELLDKVKFYHFPKNAINYVEPTEDIDNPLAVVSYNGKLFYTDNESTDNFFKEGGKSISPNISPIDY